jgi:hypothetical protein
MLVREVVHSASESSDGSLPGQPMEGDVNGLSAADVQEIGRDEHGTSPAASDGREDPGINSL